MNRIVRLCKTVAEASKLVKAMETLGLNARIEADGTFSVPVSCESAFLNHAPVTLSSKGASVTRQGETYLIHSTEIDNGVFVVIGEE